MTSQAVSKHHSTSTSTSTSNAPGPALALTFALREFRGGLKGFYVFLACIALGVAAITGVNSVARSITTGIALQGQAILGGDVAFSVQQRDLPEAEVKFVSSYGDISKVTSMRAMARMVSGDDQTLIELKAIDNAYPLFGELTERSGPLSASDLALETAYVDQILLDRLGLSVGSELKIGQANIKIAKTIAEEPDRISEGIGFGPKVLISHETMAKTGLIQPGSLVRNTYNLRLNDPSQENLARLTAEAKSSFPDTGWRIRSRDNSAPALSRNVERFSQFLTLVGLTALIVGGVGVANAIRAFMDSKRPVIASFKSLGAPGDFVFNVYLIQIMILALIGVLCGLLLGAIAPIGAAFALSDLLPVSNEIVFYPDALALGFVYGILTAFAFAVLPLAIAREIPATALFRSTGFSMQVLPRIKYLLMLAISVIALVFLSVYLSENRFIAIVFIGAIAFAFILLRIVSSGIQKAAKLAPQVKSAEWRMAIGNIHRPGSLTPSVVLSLGLGLALLVALALIDGNLREQVSGNLPDEAPDFFFVDVQSNEIDEFRSKLQSLSPDGKVVSVPMLRGRVTELKGVRSEDYKSPNGGEWVLRGDRGVTYSKRLPENSTLEKGEWWPEDYSGPPLISFAAEEAGELGLDVGDKLKVNVLGRTIEAEISSLRNVEWQSMGINFVLVFSPNTFAGAPHSYLSTLLTDKSGGTMADGKILAEITKSYPAVTSVRVRDAIETINGLVAQLATAIRAAASVALVASILVLGGALAAGNHARLHDAVVLKTLGGTRGTLIRTFVYEYALLGFSTAIFALAAGGIASWFVISQIMGFEAEFMPTVAIVTVLVAVVLTVGFGLFGTWRILGQKAAPVLREL